MNDPRDRIALLVDPPPPEWVVPTSEEMIEDSAKESTERPQNDWEDGVAFVLEVLYAFLLEEGWRAF